MIDASFHLPFQMATLNIDVNTETMSMLVGVVGVLVAVASLYFKKRVQEDGRMEDIVKAVADLKQAVSTLEATMSSIERAAQRFERFMERFITVKEKE